MTKKEFDEKIKELRVAKKYYSTEHLKGFEYYINHNTLTIKDNTTLQKEFNKFKEFR